MKSFVVLPVVILLAACPPPPAQQQQGYATAPQGPGMQKGPPGMDDQTLMSAPVTSAPDGMADPADPADDGKRPPPPKEPPPKEQPKADDLSDVAKAMVEQHNQVRAKHCAKPLAWSPKLASVAQAWANKLKANNCAFEHSGGNYGENLAAGTSGYMGPDEVVKMWYEEIKDYDFNNPGFSMTTGHFTQVVWKGTQQVGCGMVQCKGLDVWVCNYDPPGNWEGQYRENVLPTTCKK